MPVFEAHIPAGRYSDDVKIALADALNQSLVQGLGIPEGDRFIMLTEHGPNEIFMHPTFMGMQRSDAAMFVICYLGSHRPTEDKKSLVAAIERLVTEALGISGDDVFVVLVPVPNEGFSFGRGGLPLADVDPKW